MADPVYSFPVQGLLNSDLAVTAELNNEIKMLKAERQSLQSGGM